MLWYDPKMKNYEMLVKHLDEKRLMHASIEVLLVVDKPEHMKGVLEIWQSANDFSDKSEKYRVLLKRPLTDSELLLSTFGEDAPAEEFDGEAAIELEPKRNFFYLINPGGQMIDCAKIYSFLHEKNIYKRIVAKVSKDVDDRIQERQSKNKSTNVE